MELYKTLRKDTDREHWKEGLLWFGWAAICGLLPIWATIFFLYLYKQDIQASYLVDHGEFALYSASYIGACLYIVIKDFRKAVFPSKGVISLALVLLLLLSSFLFSQIAASNLISEISNESNVILIDVNAVQSVSFVLLPVSLLLAYLIMVVENVRLNANYNKITAEQYDELAQQFDSIQDD